MSKKFKILIGLLVLLVIGLIFALFRDKLEQLVKEDYSIVYLSTGEVYIGQLAVFPDLQLKNPYILQVTKDATDPAKSNFQLQPIKDALWAPQSLHLIKDNVIFYGRLMSDSKLAQTLAEKKK